MIYNSVNNEKIKSIKKLHSKKYRDLTNLFLVEGLHLVNEAYNSGVLKEILVLESSNLKLDAPSLVVTDNVMKHLSLLTTPCEVIGVCYKKSSTLISGNKILLLGDIQDPGNLGTIIRSSVSFNIDTIVLSKTSVDIYNSKVIRSSQGMIFNINIVVLDLDIVINDLKNKGYKIYGTRVNGGTDIKTIEMSSKFAIIMGNEGNGVSNNLLELCDDYIYININQACESLNVAVATSIILYELDK